jgi:hypothetical protein
MAFAIYQIQQIDKGLRPGRVALILLKLFVVIQFRYNKRLVMKLTLALPESPDCG